MPRWTTESRQKQSKLMQQLRPWERSTGPKTYQGKQRSSQNANKGKGYDKLSRTLRSIQACYDRLGIDVGSD